MINTLLFMLLLFLFFSYALVSVQFMFPIIAVGIVVIFLIKKFEKSISISKEDIIWFLCVIISLIGLIKAPNINEAIIYVGFIFVFVLLKISLSNLENWEKIFVNGALFLSSIHVISTLIQYFNPTIVQAIDHMILPSAGLNINRYQLSVGKYAGITGQVGANAFFITIFLAILFCLFIENKKKYLTGSMFIIGFIALLLTTKRGLLLFNITTLVFIVLIVKFTKTKQNNKITQFSLIIILIVLIIIVGISIIGILPLLGQLLADDNSALERMKIYRETFELIKSAPVFGNGLNSVENFVGIKAHNIYLQLWCELGLIGLITYLSTMLVTLKNSIKLYISIKNEEYLNFNSIVLISIYIQSIFILYGLTGNVLYDYFIVGMYMVAISLPGSIRYRLKNKLSNM